MAEQFAFEQRLRQSGTVNGDKWVIAPRSVVV